VGSFLLLMLDYNYKITNIYIIIKARTEGVYGRRRWRILKAKPLVPK